jgi:hypothetical protein
MATAQFMMVAAISMLFLALLLHLVAVQYASGVVRAALDEGVRIGSPARAGPADCLAGINRVLADLMRGPLGEGIETRCEIVGGQVVAGARAEFSGWFPGFPAIEFETEVRGVKETDS